MKRTARWVGVFTALTLLMAQSAAVAAASSGSQSVRSVSAEQLAEPVIEVTVNATGSVNSRTGEATIRGTLLCSADADASWYVSVRERVSHFYIYGFGFGEASCTGEAEPWSVVVTGDNGPLKAGKALVFVEVVACNDEACAFTSVEQAVKLSGKKK